MLKSKSSTLTTIFKVLRIKEGVRKAQFYFQRKDPSFRFTSRRSISVFLSIDAHRKFSGLFYFQKKSFSFSFFVPSFFLNDPIITGGRFHLFSLQHTTSIGVADWGAAHLELIQRVAIVSCTSVTLKPHILCHLREAANVVIFAIRFHLREERGPLAFLGI
jgi:hypothetical protein